MCLQLPIAWPPVEIHRKNKLRMRTSGSDFNGECSRYIIIFAGKRITKSVAPTVLAERDNNLAM
jgi:hypothetical protein